MKRILFIAVAMLFCLAASAQVKGDKYAGLSMGAAVQSTSGAVEGSNSSSFAAQAELGMFLADNLRLGIGAGGGLQKSGQDATVSFVVNPALAYYFKLGERSYYTPEIGFSWELGNALESVPYNGWSVYVDLLSFEFRVSDAIAMAFNMGRMSMSTLNILGSTGNQLGILFNNGSLGLRYYL